MWQSISGTSCSTKRACGQTISRISDVNQHLVSLFGHRSRHNLTKKWGMIFGSKLEGKKNRRFTSRGESGWGIINSNLCLLSETYCKKRPKVWLLGPTGSEECLLEFRLKLWTRTIRICKGGVYRRSYWNQLRAKVSIYKLDGWSIPPQIASKQPKTKKKNISFRIISISADFFSVEHVNLWQAPSSQTAWGPTKKPRDKAVASWKSNKGGDVEIYIQFPTCCTQKNCSCSQVDSYLPVSTSLI